MGNTIKATEIAKELVRYGNARPVELEAAILSKEILLNRYAKPLGKVKGEWHIPAVFISNVVQAFSDKWTGLAKCLSKRNF